MEHAITRDGKSHSCTLSPQADHIYQNCPPFTPSSLQMLHMERVRKLSAFKEQAECMRQAVEMLEQGMAAMTLQARHINTNPFLPCTVCAQQHLPQSINPGHCCRNAGERCMLLKLCNVRSSSPLD